MFRDQCVSAKGEGQALASSPLRERDERQHKAEWKQVVCGGGGDDQKCFHLTIDILAGGMEEVGEKAVHAETRFTIDQHQDCHHHHHQDCFNDYLEYYDEC